MYTHEHYMLRALELAQRAEGYTYPNPLVGCVIVHQGRIIGEGYHRKAGENHEFVAWYLQIDVLEVVLPGSLYGYFFLHNDKIAAKSTA